MQHMRVGGDDAVEAVAAEQRDVAPRQILERRLVAEPAGDVAAVQLLGAEHGEVDAGAAQSWTRARRVRWPRRSNAASPSQSSTSHSPLVRDEGQATGPPPSRCGEPRGRPPGLSVARNSSSATAALPGVGAALQRLEAAQVDHGVDMLDHHRAFLDAGAAGGAGPQRVRMDHGPLADERQQRSAMRLARDAAGMVVAGIGASRARLVQGGDEVLDQLLRVERLVGGVGGADRLAAAALDAGVEAEQAVPGEIDRRFRAELCRVEVEGQSAAVAAAPSWKRAGRGWATGEARRGAHASAARARRRG